MPILDAPGELCYLALLVSLDDILNSYNQTRLKALDSDGFDLYPVTEPLLKSSLNQELGSRGQLCAVGCEYELHESRPKARAIDPLARCREKQLLYKVTDVLVLKGGFSPAFAIEMNWIIDLHQIPLTLV
jgi:hypothetical protein